MEAAMSEVTPCWISTNTRGVSGGREGSAPLEPEPGTGAAHANALLLALSVLLAAPALPVPASRPRLPFARARPLPVRPGLGFLCRLGASVEVAQLCHGQLLSGFAQGRHTKHVLRKPQDLGIIKMVDVDAQVCDDLRGDIFAVLLDVDDPMMGGIGFTLAMPQYEDRPGGRQGLGYLPPVLRVIGFVRPVGVSSTMVDLVEVAPRVSGDDVLRSPVRRRIRNVNLGHAEIDGSHNAFIQHKIGVFGHTRLRFALGGLPFGAGNGQPSF